MSESFGRCSICTLPFEFDNISSLKCGHTFHFDCITKWITHAKNCPKCRMKNTARDVTRLYVDEPDNTIPIDNGTSTSPALIQLQVQIKKTEQKLNEAIDSKLAIEIALKECKKELEKQLDNAKSHLAESKKKEAHIRGLESIIMDQKSMQEKLKISRQRLQASEFFNMIFKKKSPDEAEIERTIDKFSTKDGDPCIGEFLKILRNQYHKTEEKYRQLRASLEKERQEKNQITQKYEKTKMELYIARQELTESRKRRIVPMNGESPVSSSQRKARLSLGFSFIDHEESELKENDDSEIQCLSDHPLPTKKVENSRHDVSIEMLDIRPSISISKKNQPFTFNNDNLIKKSKEVAGKLGKYLDEENLSTIFSSNLLNGAASSSNHL